MIYPPGPPKKKKHLLRTLHIRSVADVFFLEEELWFFLFLIVVIRIFTTTAIANHSIHHIKLFYIRYVPGIVEHQYRTLAAQHYAEQHYAPICCSRGSHSTFIFIFCSFLKYYKKYIFDIFLYFCLNFVMCCVPTWPNNHIFILPFILYKNMEKTSTNSWHICADTWFYFLFDFDPVNWLPTEFVLQEKFLAINI